MRRRSDRLTVLFVVIIAAVVVINAGRIFLLQGQLDSLTRDENLRNQELIHQQIRATPLQWRLCRLEDAQNLSHPPGAVCPTPSPGG